jgi:hypothetical protein
VSAGVPDGPVADLDQAPQIVLQPPPGDTVRHWLIPLEAMDPAKRRNYLRTLIDILGPSLAFGPHEQPAVLASLGIGFDGLQALQLPLPLQQVFRRLAPAFAEGAVLRSASQLGDTGPSAASRWDAGFEQGATVFCLSLHGSHDDVQSLSDKLVAYPPKKFSPQPLTATHFGGPDGAPGHWVHFGYRDGITDVRIKGVSSRSSASAPIDCEPGSLLLGHRSDMGDNPFALATWPDLVRRFFANSSFGVLRKIQQKVDAFEAFVGGSEDLRAELCGRNPDGSVLHPATDDPAERWRLDLKQDPSGQRCPFGSHVRRMRGAGDAHGLDRPLLRRSVPYGQPLWQSDSDKEQQRGLLGHFFCSNLEMQFEHLLGQWADRVPLGSQDPGNAKDPLCGNHEADGSTWVRANGTALQGLKPWTVTRGTLYLWYPSRFAIDQLIDDAEFKAIDNWPPTP